ncbi:hypothetical protein B0H10DRAFT_1964849 [Mycena sp. CBHHK59/15]|nr:hypothetical protein B0H10DRAFT_1964849 [Mycena sp. CBHHK59/15]
MSARRKSKPTKRKADALEDAAANHVTFANPTVKRLQYTVTSDTGSRKTTSVLERLPTASLPTTSTGSIVSSSVPILENPPPKQRTSQTQLCFVEAHIRNPFHWAEVWDTTQGFFVRHDISKLNHIIQLGHNGKPCPEPCGKRLFTVVDDNGLHSTCLAFCGCRELPANKVKQLMRAGLFPATTREPQTAFTVSMLKRLHNLESKKAAYDYIGAIRRLTDNSFTADIPNPYAAFLRVVRMFNFLTLKKRTGQLHGIDAVIPHRPSGNLLVWCPARPEPGFNSDPNCPKTPHHLRHLNQSQRTLDGNFQCNQFNKNTDPDDVSLCMGKGYFPLDSEYREYLNQVPVSKEKSTCNYLKAVNKQDKKKFKNMAITGTINCQYFRTQTGPGNGAQAAPARRILPSHPAFRN